ncbi:Uncharacterised protein [Lysinibacillus sphaericus]|nr:Uncharacterised protein [Lysinibacillus sphaericus]
MTRMKLTGRQHSSLRGRIARMARKSCANYCGGCPFATCIVQIDTGRIESNVCPYFVKSVLPMDTKLESEYTAAVYGTDYDNHCERCKVGFEPTSNRQKYCPDCSAIIRKESDRIRKKNARLEESLNTAR